MESHREIIRRSSPKRVVRRRKIWKPILLLLVLGLSVLVAIFLYWPKMWITGTADIVGGRIIRQEDLQALVATELAGLYGGIVPRRHLLFYPRQEITKKIRSQFPIISSVRISLHDWNHLKIEVTERSTDLLWCAGGLSVSLSASKDCYFMDGHGFVFSSAPAFSGQTYEEIFAPFVGSPIGKRYLLDDQLSAIRRVTKGITAITSRSPLVSSTLERTYYLGRDQLTLLFTDTGHSNRWLLRLTVATSTSEILNNFDSVVTADIFAKDFQKNKGRLEYFDLRFGRKIYYRFR